MNALEKQILDILVKPPVTAILAQLTANEAANIEALEAVIPATGGNAVVAVVAFMTTKIKSPNAIVAGIEGLVLPELEAALTTELGTVAQDVPTLYATGLAFVTKELGYI